MKRIIIIGGGISGLAALHFLSQRFGAQAEITLYERQEALGGTIRSIALDQGLIEWGPNGFLDNQATTFELITDLNLEKNLVAANTDARRRFIQKQGVLYPVPKDPIAFLLLPLLSFSEKLRFFKGLFLKSISQDQSIYDYVKARFGVGIAENFVDPFISGVYAGDIKALHMQAAFPKVFAKPQGKKKLTLHSFKGGMGQLVEALRIKYQGQIITQKEITDLSTIKADEVILATPAYVAKQLLKDINPALSYLLGKIYYAPVVVVALVFNAKAFKKVPQGFGYLIPSKEKKEVLGVLIESNVFANRAAEGFVTLRVMLGGAHHPAIINDDTSVLLNKALTEIDAAYGLKEGAENSFVKAWPQGIPQYNLDYPSLRHAITKELANTPQLKLCANYLDGVSFNDCINNAKSIAVSLAIC